MHNAVDVLRVFERVVVKLVSGKASNAVVAVVRAFGLDHVNPRKRPLLIQVRRQLRRDETELHMVVEATREAETVGCDGSEQAQSNDRNHEGPRVRAAARTSSTTRRPPK